MRKINAHMLSGRALLAFDAVARAGSFSGAAKMLNIGQPAVSHGVRALESRLGTRLFRRSASGAQLTADGAVLARHVRAGFTEIERGLAQVYRADRDNCTVRLHVSSSLANFWLLPRLAKFKRAHPGVVLSVVTQDSDEPLRNGEQDLAIPLDGGEWPGYLSWHFVDERVGLVCSPAYAEKLRSRALVSVLSEARLVHLLAGYKRRCGWGEWYRLAALPLAEHAGCDGFNDYSIVLQAALEGQGVALGWHHLVQPLIDSGRLVYAVDEQIDGAGDFVILAPEDRPLSDAATKLRDWLIHEAKTTR